MKSLFRVVPNDPKDKLYALQLNKMFEAMSQKKLDELILSKIFIPKYKITLEELNSLWEKDNDSTFTQPS
jgi:predicted alpha/beta-fold hydrolase